MFTSIDIDTANAHTRAAFITGKVNVIRLGGGFGESVIGATHLAVSFSKACPGNREQVCPSGPMPSSSRSNRGKGDREYLDIYLQEIYGTGDGYGITILIYNRNMGSPMIALVVKYGTVFSSFGIRIFESLNDSMIKYLDIYLQEIYGTGDGYGITILIYNRNMGSPMIALVVKYGTVERSFMYRHVCDQTSMFVVSNDRNKSKNPSLEANIENMKGSSVCLLNGNIPVLTYGVEKTKQRSNVPSILCTYLPTCAQAAESAHTAAFLKTRRTEVEGGKGSVGFLGFSRASSSGAKPLPNNPPPAMTIFRWAVFDSTVFECHAVPTELRKRGIYLRLGQSRPAIMIQWSLRTIVPAIPTLTHLILPEDPDVSDDSDDRLLKLQLPSNGFVVLFDLAQSLSVSSSYHKNYDADNEFYKGLHITSDVFLLILLRGLLRDLFTSISVSDIRLDTFGFRVNTPNGVSDGLREPQMLYFI
ncbi:hypothetical protein HUJ05_010192 [Dendroctonus ponderosae]|nr:hypothetical protein HUJ05_010192 [Dendroctonus ponderosae]